MTDDNKLQDISLVSEPSSKRLNECQKIDFLAGHPDALDAMSRAARASVEGRDWDHVAAQVETVYRQVHDGA